MSKLMLFCLLVIACYIVVVAPEVEIKEEGTGGSTTHESSSGQTHGGAGGTVKKGAEGQKAYRFGWTS